MGALLGVCTAGGKIGVKAMYSNVESEDMTLLLFCAINTYGYGPKVSILL